MARSMNEIAAEIHDWALGKGWWEVPVGIIKANDPRTEEGEEVRRWARLKIIMEKLALIGTEVSEAIEELRNGRAETETYFADVSVHPEPWVSGDKPEGFPSELADGIIRYLDLAAFCKIDIDEAVAQKMAYNYTREHRHGGKLA